MTNIYDQHAKSFPHVAAYVIMKDSERVATIAFKFPKDGAGRLYAYVHWIGAEMVRGHANGYGYDKKSAACESAVSMFSKTKAWTEKGINAEGLSFLTALRDIGGSTWDRALENAGFTVLQAV